MSPRALIVGGNGFIGSHVIDELTSRDWPLHVLDRSPELFRPPVPGVDYFLGSFADRELLRGALDEVEVVFHLASTTIPETSNSDPGKDISANLVETVHLIDECVRCEVKRFVFVSSGGTVYGIPNSVPVKEQHPTDPVCSYGVVKLSIEKYLRVFYEMHGLEYTIVRPANPFGPRQNPSGRQGAISVFLGKILRGEPITVWGDGSIERDFFYISDLAVALRAAAQTSVPNGVFNIGSGRCVSLNQVLATLRSVTGRSPEVHYETSRVFDVPRICLCIEEARDKLGWSPLVQLEEGVARTWHWLSNLRTGQTTGHKLQSDAIGDSRHPSSAQIGTPPKGSC